MNHQTNTTDKDAKPHHKNTPIQNTPIQNTPMQNTPMQNTPIQKLYEAIFIMLMIVIATGVNDWLNLKSAMIFLIGVGVYYGVLRTFKI